MSETRKLSENELDWLIEDTYQGIPINETIKKLDFNGRREFNQFLKNNPDIKQIIKEAEIEACDFLENDLLNVHRKAKMDHKLARVLADTLLRVLQFRKPEKYGNKIDLNMNVVSVAVNLEKANDRIKALMRDVTPDVPVVLEAPKPAEPLKEKPKKRPKSPVLKDPGLKSEPDTDQNPSKEG